MRIIKAIRTLSFALLIAFIFLTPTPSTAQVAVGVSVSFVPPDLPVYEQPICPGDGYLWTPGYWAWDDADGDYFWVPGTWVLAPQPGFFWTPGYWAWGGNGFFFTAGYWGPVVGFYGGINYGFGYFGHGYEGGRWDHDHFFYNRTVNNVNTTVIHNTYNTTIVNNNTTVTRVSYNGGNGGINARATSQEEAAARERHVAPVAAQTQHVQEARSNRDLRASVNHGAPPVAATPKPGAFKDRGIVATREAGAVHAPTKGGGSEGGSRPANNNRPTYIHPNDVPPAERSAPPNTGNAKLDQKYQQQQQKLADKQAKENQKLQQQQEKEHQKVAQQQANDARKQQMEQRHQQQTQQLQQRHEQQQHQMQQRQQPRPAPPPPNKPH
jgi:hypothetical protein